MRGKLEIVADILSEAKNPSTKTSIVYGANLSFEQAERYLEHCLDWGLLRVFEEKNKNYQITEKGREFLETVDSLREMIYERDGVLA